MSFNAKNLTYGPSTCTKSIYQILIDIPESNEPSFLRKLKSEYGGNNSGRHERPLARPRKHRGADEDEDDAPTYVDEESHDTFTKTEYEALMNTKDETVPQAKDVKGEEATDLADGGAESTSIAKDQAVELPNPAKREIVATIGGIGKRRLAKVVGEYPDGEESKEIRKSATGVKKTTNPKKKVKLSFDEEAS